jgi:uncharacterized membrane protein YczE
MEGIKYYFIGLMILVFAILANFLALQLGLKTWYAFLEGWGNGNPLKIKDGLWLFVIYPLILGCSAKLASLIWNLLF